MGSEVRSCVDATQEIVNRTGTCLAIRVTFGFLVAFTVLAVLPYTHNAAIDVKVLGYEVAAFLGVALWMASPSRTRDSGFHAPLIHYAVLVFFVATVAASAVSRNPAYSLYYECAKWAALCLIFLVSSHAYRTEAHVWRLLAVTTVAVAVASLYGFVQYKGWDPFPWQDHSGMLRTAPSTYGNPNLASHVLTPAIILVIGLVTQKGYRWAILCLPFFVAHFALTQTRGALIALACAATVVAATAWYSRRVGSPTRAIATAIGCMVALGVVGTMAVAFVTYQRTGQWFPYDKGESITLRYHSVYGACRMIQDSPWFGYGPGMYEVANPPYWTVLEQKRFGSQLKYNDHVHNEPLEFAVDSGLLGAWAFLAIQVLGLVHGLTMAVGAQERSRRILGLTLGAFFMAFLVDGQFGFNAHVPVSGLLLFLVAGVTAGLARGHGHTTAQKPSAKFFPALCAVALISVAAFQLVWGVRDFTAKVFNQYGRGALEQEASEAALKSFAKAAALAPYDWLHPYFAGLSAAKLERHEEAVRYFEDTLRRHPNYVLAQFRLAESLFNLAAPSTGEVEPSLLERAIHTAGQARSISPYSPEPYDILGRTAYLQAQLANPGNGSVNHPLWKVAEEHLGKAIEYGGKDPFKLYQLTGMARFSGGDAAGAQEALLMSLERKPDEPETWRLLFQVCSSTDRFDELTSAIERRLDSPKGPPPLLEDEEIMLRSMHAGLVASEYGDEEGAEHLYSDLVGAFPHRPEAWSAYYGFAQKTGRLSTFETELLEAGVKATSAGHPLTSPMDAVVTALSNGEGGVESGVSLLVAAFQKSQSAPTPVFNARDTFLWAAHFLATKADSAELPPASAGGVFLDLGIVFGACQDFQGASELIARALPHLEGEQRILALIRKGTAHLYAEQPTEAVAAFETAISLAPANIEARHGVAQSLARAGRRDEAMASYEAILRDFEMDDRSQGIIERELDLLRSNPPR